MTDDSDDDSDEWGQKELVIPPVRYIPDASDGDNGDLGDGGDNYWAEIEATAQVQKEPETAPVAPSQSPTSVGETARRHDPCSC